MYNALEKNKVYNATRYLDGEAQKFYMYLVTMNDGKVSIWKEFRHSLISRYYHPVSREDILRQKLLAVPFKGAQRISSSESDSFVLKSMLVDFAKKATCSFLRKPLPH